MNSDTDNILRDDSITGAQSEANRPLLQKQLLVAASAVRFIFVFGLIFTVSFVIIFFTVRPAGTTDSLLSLRNFVFLSMVMLTLIGASIGHIGANKIKNQTDDAYAYTYNSILFINASVWVYVIFVGMMFYCQIRLVWDLLPSICVAIAAGSFMGLGYRIHKPQVLMDWFNSPDGQRLFPVSRRCLSPKKQRRIFSIYFITALIAFILNIVYIFHL